MITVNKDTVELKGTFMVLLAELQSVVKAMDNIMVDNPQLNMVFQDKSVLEIITEIADVRKKIDASGLTTEEYLAKLKKK